MWWKGKNSYHGNSLASHSGEQQYITCLTQTHQVSRVRFQPLPYIVLYVRCVCCWSKGVSLETNIDL